MENRRFGVKDRSSLPRFSLTYMGKLCNGNFVISDDDATCVEERIRLCMHYFIHINSNKLDHAVAVVAMDKMLYVLCM